jgi:hypothetical protein
MKQLEKIKANFNWINIWDLDNEWEVEVEHVKKFNNVGVNIIAANSNSVIRVVRVVRVVRMV